MYKINKIDPKITSIFIASYYKFSPQNSKSLLAGFVFSLILDFSIFATNSSILL